MPFVKLDCNILRSTLWFERLQREIFITALLMAEPMFVDEPLPQIKVRSLESTGWSVPPDKETPYGFVAAAGVGIVRLAMANDSDMEAGLDALEKLGEPEESSRTPDFDGRRLVRVNGGYVVLNYGKYRERDYTAAERQKRWRERHKNNGVTPPSNGVTSRYSNVTSRKQKQSTEAETDKKGSANKSRQPALSDEEWLQQLSQNPTYAGIDVPRLHGKLITWCNVRGLKPTRRRLVNWLNREEKPLNNGSNQRHTTESGRGLGTANEGKSSQYAGVGKIR